MVKSKFISNKYNALVKSNKVFNDEGQKEVLNSLDSLYYLIKTPFSFKSIFLKKKIMGIYIYGDVGRGKSYLMDIFYQSVISKHSLRIHQHVFMYEIYEHLNRANKLNKKNPFKYAVRQFTKNISLLCVDEFEVLDVADAMILERLYKELYSKGVKVVLTSNTEPNLLYNNGLQRNRFIPFIDLINNVMIVNKIGSGKDYRVRDHKTREISHFQEFYFVENKTLLLENLFSFLSAGNKIDSLNLKFKSRNFYIPKCSNNVAFFHFDQLCNSNCSSLDYIHIVNKFSWIVISDIPKLSAKDRNTAKRFQGLIDIMYDEKLGLAVSSDVKPKDIYEKGDGSKEFARTVSRLYEMTNKSWLYKIKDNSFKSMFNM